MMDLLLVDDHELVRAGIRRLLDDAPGIRVVGEADSGEQAIKLVKEKRPGIVVMDVNMPGVGGLETTRKLLQIDPDLKIIIVTVHAEEPYPSKLLEAGALGYLTKSCAVKEIVEAIYAVNEGQRYLCADVAKQLALTKLMCGNQSPLETLSQREMQVMLMVTQGHSIQDISDRLCLSPKTVSTYRYRLYEKLQVENDVELTHLAMRHGMLGVKNDES